MEPNREPPTPRSMPQAVNSTPLRAVGAALAVIIAATACNGPTGNSGGTTTIVTSVVNNGGGSPTTTTSNAHVINDKAALCNLFSSRGKEIANAVNGLTSLAQHKDWQWSEPDISTAGDKVISTIDKAVPILRESIGPQIPQDVVVASKAVIDAASDYSAAVKDRVDSDKLNNAFDKLYGAEGDFDVACGYKK